MARSSSKTGSQIEEAREGEDILLTNLVCPLNEEKVPSSVSTDRAKTAKTAGKRLRKFGDFVVRR